MNRKTTRGQDRRQFLKVAALGTAGATMSVAAGARGVAESQATGAGSVRLGVASYSLRNLSRADAIAAIRALKAPWVNIKSFHLPYESTPAELAAGRREFEDAGLELLAAAR